MVCDKYHMSGAGEEKGGPGARHSDAVTLCLENNRGLFALKKIHTPPASTKESAWQLIHSNHPIDYALPNDQNYLSGA